MCVTVETVVQSEERSSLFVGSLRTEVAHASDISESGGATRPAGVRHEIIADADPAFALVREVWFFSDNGEIRHADERRIAINDLVHLVVNMTDAERRFFSETRTTWPERDWEGVPTAKEHELTVSVSADSQKILDYLRKWVGYEGGEYASVIAKKCSISRRRFDGGVQELLVHNLVHVTVDEGTKRNLYTPAKW